MDLPGLDPGSAGGVSSISWRPGGVLGTPGCRGTKASQGVFLGFCVDSCVLVCNHYRPLSTLHRYISVLSGLNLSGFKDYSAEI